MKMCVFAQSGLHPARLIIAFKLCRLQIDGADHIHTRAAQGPCFSHLTTTDVAFVTRVLRLHAQKTDARTSSLYVDS